MTTDIVVGSLYLDITPYPEHEAILLPLIFGLSAGFPSPAADFIDLDIDLGRLIVKNPSCTFLGRVKGESMQDVHINNGDIVVIDKSRVCKNGDIAVCVLDGEFLVKRVIFEDQGCWLVPENPKYKSIHVTSANEFQIWGVVISVIKFL